MNSQEFKEEYPFISKTWASRICKDHGHTFEDFESDQDYTIYKNDMVVTSSLIDWLGY